MDRGKLGRFAGIFLAACLLLRAGGSAEERILILSPRLPNIFPADNPEADFPEAPESPASAPGEDYFLYDLAYFAKARPAEAFLIGERTPSRLRHPGLEPRVYPRLVPYIMDPDDREPRAVDELLAP